MFADCYILHTKGKPSSIPDGKNEQIGRGKHFKQCLTIEHCWILAPNNVFASLYVIYIFC